MDLTGITDGFIAHRSAVCSKETQEVNPLLAHNASLTLSMCAHGRRQLTFPLTFWRTSY